ncbi:MAG: hypothetical protein ACRDTC_26680 [Pseudonocardiaceae bacterium]
MRPLRILRTLAGGPVNRMPLVGADLFAWMALRRVYQGHLAKLDDRYFDGGRPIPGYLTEALDALTGTGLAVLAEADPLTGGLRRVVMTDPGKGRYVTLHERAQPGTQPRTRWALSPLDYHSHALRDGEGESLDVLVARCGHPLPSSVEPATGPAPHRAVCTDCIATVVGPPRFGTG